MDNALNSKLEQLVTSDILPHFLQNSNIFYTFVLDIDANYIYANELFCNKLEYKLDFLQKRDFFYTLHQDSLKMFKHTFSEFLKKNDVSNTLEIKINQQVSPFYISAEFNKLFDKDNQITAILVIASDISEEQQILAQYKDLEIINSAMSIANSDANLLIGSDFKIRAFNKLVESNVEIFFNKKIEIDQDYRQYLIPQFDKEFYFYFHKALAGESNQIEMNLHFESINTWFKLGFYPVYNKQNLIDAVLLNSINIDNQKRIEFELKQKDERTGIALLNLNYGLYEIDFENDVLIVSSEYLKLVNYHTDSYVFPLQYWFYNIHPEDKEVLVNNFDEYQKGRGEYFKAEYRLKVSDNDWIWISSKGKIIERKSDGLAKKMVGMITDISKSKKDQESLLMLTEAVEISPAIVLITDTNGKIEYVNSKFIQITGYKKDEILYKNISILKSGIHSKEFYEHLWNSLTKGQSWTGEFYNKKKNNEYYWELASISPIFENGKITNYIHIGEDITARKNLEENLNIALNRALESDKLKNAFLSNLSHEIRTPLNGILGFMTILNTEEVNENERAEFTNLLKNSGRRLISLVDELISMSKIETKQYEVDRNEFSVLDLLDELYSRFYPYIDSDKVTFNIDSFNEKKDFVLNSDRQIITQIIYHLMNNSMKFTKKGYIKIGFEVLVGEILFFVKDSGIGIAEEKKFIIFEKFRQLEEHLNRTNEGIGLGLSICKGFVDILKGKIWLESEENKGTAFYFTIPINND